MADNQNVGSKKRITLTSLIVLDEIMFKDKSFFLRVESPDSGEIKLVFGTSVDDVVEHIFLVHDDVYYPSTCRVSRVDFDMDTSIKKGILFIKTSLEGLTDYQFTDFDSAEDFFFTIYKGLKGRMR